MRDNFAFAPQNFNRKEDIVTHALFLRVQVRNSP
jgi:hypothetical protein